MQAFTTTNASEEEVDKKFRGHVERMLRYLEWMQQLHKDTVKTQTNIEKFRKQFEKSTATMGWDPGFVYLAKICTSIERRGKDGKIIGAQEKFENGQKIILGFDHLSLEYTTAKVGKDKARETFSVSGAQLDYNVEKRQEAEMALMERVQMAVIAVNAAKMLGWEYISFKTIKDPVDAYIMHGVCKALKIKTLMPEFDRSTLPAHEKIENFDMATECVKVIQTMLADPDAPIVTPKLPEAEHAPVTANTIKKAAAFFKTPKAA